MPRTTVTTYPQPTQVAETAEQLQANFVACRTIRHSWWFINERDLPPTDLGDWVVLFCERCGMKRIELRDEGRLLYRRYEQPPGYKLSREVTRDNLWAELLVRRANGQLAVRSRPRVRN